MFSTFFPVETHTCNAACALVPRGEARSAQHAARSTAAVVRSQMLKNQLAGVAPDAAALISRGDSLVYAKHREDPALAEFLRVRYQDELRSKWSTVMAEMEAERGAALRAEEGVRRLAALAERLRAGLRELEAGAGGHGAQAGEMRAACGELRALCGELRALRVAFPERAALETAAAAERAAERFDFVDVQVRYFLKCSNLFTAYDYRL